MMTRDGDDRGQTHLRDAMGRFTDKLPSKKRHYSLGDRPEGELDAIGKRVTENEQYDKMTGERHTPTPTREKAPVSRAEYHNIGTSDKTPLRAARGRSSSPGVWHALMPKRQIAADTEGTKAKLEFADENLDMVTDPETSDANTGRWTWTDKSVSMSSAFDLSVTSRSSPTLSEHSAQHSGSTNPGLEHTPTVPAPSAGYSALVSSSAIEVEASGFPEQDAANPWHQPQSPKGQDGPPTHRADWPSRKRYPSVQPPEVMQGQGESKDRTKEDPFNITIKWV